MQYRGYTIQEVGYGFIVRDLSGRVMVEVGTTTKEGLQPLFLFFLLQHIKV